MAIDLAIVAITWIDEADITRFQPVHGPLQLRL